MKKEEIEKKINKILEDYRIKRSNAWDNYRAVCNEETDKVSEIINFKGKYLKIKDRSEGDNCYIYLKVLDQYVGKYCSTDKPGITLVGVSYYSYYSEDNSIYFNVDSVLRYDIDLTNIKEELEVIEEISEEEFKNNYYKVVENVREKLFKLL